MDSHYPNKIAWCRICDQGWIEIVKGADTNKLFAMCNECESEWTHPEDAISKQLPRTGMEELVLEPSCEDIKRKGWDRYITND